MTSKAQDFLLAQSSSDISVQLCTRWTAELSHSEYEQLWFIHSCQSWWVTGTVLTAHTSQKFPRAKSIPGRRKDRSIFPPLAPNKAQPWPEKKSSSGCTTSDWLLRSFEGHSPALWEHLQIKNSAFNPSSSFSFKLWAAPWCYPRTRMLKEQSFISERKAGKQPGLLKLHK